MSGRFKDQVAIVTGAVGGIGSAIVEGFLAEGGRVGLIDFNAQGGQAYEKELRKRGHPDAQIIGSLGGPATLGLLIPPSIILIVYGVAAETSIAKLFIAGIIPGLLLAALFSGWLMGWALLHPERIDDPAVRQAIARLGRGFATPADYFVRQLSEGVGTIAAAFHPLLFQQQ